MIAAPAQMDAAADEMGIGQQMVDAGNAFEDRHERSGIEVVYRRTQGARKAFLAGAREFLLDGFDAELFPGDGVVRARKHARQFGGAGGLEKIVDDVAEAYDFLVDMLRGRISNATIIITTVYDPSDGTGRIPGVHEQGPALPLDILDRLNNHIRTLATGTPNILLADAHRHFLGHGVAAAEADQWYWKRSLIEPNARGASEIRHLWLDALRDTGETPA